MCFDVNFSQYSTRVHYEFNQKIEFLIESIDLTLIFLKTKNKKKGIWWNCQIWPFEHIIIIISIFSILQQQQYPVSMFRFRCLFVIFEWPENYVSKKSRNRKNRKFNESFSRQRWWWSSSSAFAWNQSTNLSLMIDKMNFFFVEWNFWISNFFFRNWYPDWSLMIIITDHQFAKRMKKEKGKNQTANSKLS